MYSSPRREIIFQRRADTFFGVTVLRKIVSVPRDPKDADLYACVQTDGLAGSRGDLGSRYKQPSSKIIEGRRRKAGGGERGENYDVETGRRLFLSVGRNADVGPSIPSRA